MNNAMKFLNKKVLLASGMLVFGLATVAGFTGAFFSDTETSQENVFQAGTLDLEVGMDSDSTLGFQPLASLTGNEALFNFQGLIPGASEGSFFTLRASSDAWACVAPTLGDTPENDRLAPEISSGDISAGSNSGELQNFLQVAMWTDADEDGTFSTGDSDLQVFDVTDMDGTYLPLFDSSTTGTYMDSGDRREVGMAYCFGEFTNPSNPSAGCDGSNPDTNQAQTDAAELTFAFLGMQRANNDSFTCDSLNPVSVTVDSGWTSVESGRVLFAKARWNNSGFEYRVGSTDPDSTDGNTTWTDNTPESFVLTYDATTGEAELEIDGRGTVMHPVGTSLTSTMSQIAVYAKANDAGTSVDVTNLSIDGIGALSSTSVSSAGAGVQHWLTEPLDLSSGFTLRGDFVFDSNSNQPGIADEDLVLQIGVN
jgi:predicted ribosomally synthesized peptide with SipW-like signal peptide